MLADINDEDVNIIQEVRLKLFGTIGGEINEYVNTCILIRSACDK